MQEFLLGLAAGIEIGIIISIYFYVNPIWGNSPDAAQEHSQGSMGDQG